MSRHWLPAVVLVAACGVEPADQPPFSVSATLGGASDQGYARATGPLDFQFPRDHGAHPRFKHEWWYFTGNLVADNGRRYGYQFTLFRRALDPLPPAGGTRWSTNQVYLAHAALTDVEDGTFLHDERYARGALGLAGVSTRPFGAWLEDWRIDEVSAGACTECFHVSLRASARDFALDLTLRSSKPPVRHGENGFSSKSQTPGNASYYYSHTRLATRGTIRRGGTSHPVTGSSWFDHEWSTSALERDQAGWDWFALQLEDDTEVMLFRLRHRSDPALDHVYGSYIGADGGLVRLTAGDLDIRSTAQWRSRRSGAVYPAAWQIHLPRQDLLLEVRPRLADQEMLTSFRYWEGAVEVYGERDGARIDGQGYVELTGYGAGG
jgi:predicted secreted hydrolase